MYQVVAMLPPLRVCDIVCDMHWTKVVLSVTSISFLQHVVVKCG